MVNFYSCYVISDCDKRNATVTDVVRHVEHIRSVAGVEHIGIGGDFNGVEEFPEGLQDVSQYPNVRSIVIIIVVVIIIIVIITIVVVVLLIVVVIKNKRQDVSWYPNLRSNLINDESSSPLS